MRLTDEQLHAIYIHIEDPFIPRWQDVGQETAKAQEEQTLKTIGEWLDSILKPDNLVVPTISKLHESVISLKQGKFPGG